MTTWTHEKLSVSGADASHVVAGTRGVEEGSQHLFFSGSDAKIHELAWTGRGERRKRPLAGGGGQLASHAVASEDTQHVFHLSDRHVWEIYWTGGQAPSHGDLMPDVMDDLLKADGGLASHVTPDGTQHVFYTTQLGHAPRPTSPRMARST